jgi:hypothetical protein
VLQTEDRWTHEIEKQRQTFETEVESEEGLTGKLLSLKNSAVRMLQIYVGKLIAIRNTNYLY